jgi:fatty acid desaturase
MNRSLTSTIRARAVPPRSWAPGEAATFTQELRRRLREQGVFSGDKRGYVVRSLYVLGVTALMWLGFLWADDLAVRLLLGVLGGYCSVQASAIAHEAGHGAVTRERSWTRFVGHLFMTVVVGAAFSAWVERHGAHHLHPNSGKDPDVRPGLFSFSEADARKASGLGGWLTRHQHLLLPPLSTFMGFTLKLACWRSVLRRPLEKRLDVALLVLHVLLWIALPALWIGVGDALVNYALITWVKGVYLALVFIPNHLGGPTLEEAREWPAELRQIVTTRNLPATPWMTHICVGLNTHIEHHLFGLLPATRLPEARAATREMCRTHGVPYHECTLREAFAEVHAYNVRMATIARDARLERLSYARTCRS